ncbi:MAG: hypothetical protein WA395_03990, partial [Nitrososphaeraceae archaeon]
MTILARIWLVGLNTLACLIHFYDITLVITIRSGDSRIKSTFDKKVFGDIAYFLILSTVNTRLLIYS